MNARYHRLLQFFAMSLFAAALLVGGYGCKKEHTNEPTVESTKSKTVAAPIVLDPKISLDTIPYEPYAGDELLHDLSIVRDTVKAPEVVRDSTGAITYTKPGLVDSMLFVAQKSMYERKLDSLKSLYNYALQSKTLLLDSLEQSRNEYSSSISGMEKRKTLEDSSEIQRVAKVARMIENMKPAEAAALLDQLPLKFAAHVVVKLKERQSGKVLAALQPAKASQIALLIKSGDYLLLDDETKTAAKSTKSNKKATGK